LVAGKVVPESDTGFCLIGNHNFFEPKLALQGSALGRDGITIVPYNRWDVEDIHSADSTLLTTRFGSFLDDIEYFDREVFQIGSAEATYMDPQQCLLLSSNLAVISRSKMANGNTGIFVGISSSDYNSLLLKTIVKIPPFLATGIAMSCALLIG
jgi:acyl transferase domain-containing protein